MKLNLFFYLIFVFFVKNTVAQDIEKSAQTLSKSICSCTKDRLYELDEEALAVKITVFQKNEELENSGTTYLEGLPAEMQTRVKKAFDVLIANRKIINKCLTEKKSLEKHLKALLEKLTNRQAMEMLIKYAKTIKNCDLTQKTLTIMVALSEALKQ